MSKMLVIDGKNELVFKHEDFADLVDKYMGYDARNYCRKLIEELEWHIEYLNNLEQEIDEAQCVIHRLSVRLENVVGITKSKDKNVYFVYRHNKGGEVTDIHNIRERLDYDFGDDEQYAKDVAEALNEMEEFRRTQN